MAPGIFRRGADSSDEGAKMWLSGYCKCQKFPKNSLFTFRRGAGMVRRGGYSPLALPWRHLSLRIVIMKQRKRRLKVDYKYTEEDILQERPTRGLRAACGFLRGFMQPSQSYCRIYFLYVFTLREFNKIFSYERKVWGDAHALPLV